MFKRLKGASGQVTSQPDSAGDSDSKLVRPAILVHSGPDGTPLVFESSDGEIKFDAARIKTIVEKQNQLVSGLADQYGGMDKMPLGAHFPIKDEHENGSAMHHIIGRMGDLLQYEVRDIPGVGKNCACAVTNLTFLGAAVVERVKDGRIYNLSVGIADDPEQESYNTLNEVSAVIVPAAPGAMLLSKGKPTLSGPTKKEKKMPINLKRVQAHTKRLSVLTQMDEGFKALGAKAKETKEFVTLTKKTNDISKRLGKLMASAKLTPAERKNIDVKRLAKLPEDALETVLSSYELREPVINPRQAGSTHAIDFTELSRGMKKKEIKNLKSEIRGDFKKLSGGKVQMAGDDEDGKDLGGGNKEHEINPGKDDHAVPGEGGYQMAAEFHEHMKHMGKCMAAGDMEGAKEAHGKAMKHLEEHGDKHLAFGSDVKSEDEQKGMSELESKVDELSTQMARYSAMVHELMGVEKEEGHELAAAEDKEEKPEPGQE